MGAWCPSPRSSPARGEGAGVAGAAITALYAFRMVFLVFFGRARTGVSRVAGWRMGLPLVVCGLFALGAGETTLLRMAAGFEKPDEGRVLLDGRDITDLPPEQRPVYVGLTNTLVGVMVLFPFIGGTIADHSGYVLMMATFGVMFLLSAITTLPQSAARPSSTCACTATVCSGSTTP